MASEAERPVRVLFVCTGNICRSPLAEAFARRELAAWRAPATRPGPAGRPEPPLEVASAGTHALDGHPATEEAIRAAAARGGELVYHHARRLTRQQIEHTDLVLCMAGEHHSFVLAMARKAARRTFLLSSFARAIEHAVASGPRALAERAAERAEVLVGDDVDDPIWLDQAAYDACAERLDGLVTYVVRRLLDPLGPSTPPAPKW